MSERIFNFSAGPAVLPESVLRASQAALWDLDGSGIGVMEHSHRGPQFSKVIEECEADCRRLASIPDEYAVLFLQGGASLQFSMVPMNLLAANTTADYLNTGAWSKKAIKEARRVGQVHIAASSEDEGFSYVPAADAIRYSASPAYVHFTSNNTIVGTEWATAPTPPEGVPLVCDASSDIFSRPIDVTRYGVIYAGAQKNLGPSGVTLVIIHKDLVAIAPDNLPTMLQYRTHVNSGSMFNTPSTFGIYVMGQVFKWMLENGGLTAMAERNEAKAKIVYDFLDQSEMFAGTAWPESRSRMNICFRGASESLEKKFLSEASARGLSGLKGHRSVGGMRASTYNALPEAACRALVAFMDEFERENR